MHPIFVYLSGNLILTTTEAGYSTHFQRNWIHFVNVSTAEIEKTIRLEDYYWFPAMPIFLNENSDATKIETVVCDSGKVEYYNMQGLKVNTPNKGIYIKRQGAKSIKVIF